jgi:hypothetical protein
MDISSSEVNKSEKKNVADNYAKFINAVTAKVHNRFRAIFAKLSVERLMQTLAGDSLPGRTDPGQDCDVAGVGAKTS